MRSLGPRNLVDVKEEQSDLRTHSFSSTVISGFQRKARDIQVNEFKLACLEFPGSLIKGSAEHATFCLDGSQMETCVWSRAELSAPCMMCCVNDGRLL